MYISKIYSLRMLSLTWELRVQCVRGEGEHVHGEIGGGGELGLPVRGIIASQGTVVSNLIRDLLRLH